jgi:hypothetical protein
MDPRSGGRQVQPDRDATTVPHEPWRAFGDRGETCGELDHLPSIAWACWRFAEMPLPRKDDGELVRRVHVHVSVAGLLRLTWLDDQSRMALHISAHPRVTGPVVLTTFRATINEYGCPAATLTDNGMVYTVRHSAWGVRGGRNAFETELATLGITQKNGRGNHPQTQGKVERFQQTLKTWLARQPTQPATLTDLQALLDTFRSQYNHHRPHRALDRRTPAAAYTARPKATPAAEPPDRTHTRVRTDKVNNGKITLRHGGTLYAIGIGRSHNGKPVKALIHGLNITISDATTGEILRDLTLDTTHRYQPQKRQQGEP